MSLGLLGKKIGMTQVFQSNGSFAPVTVIEAGPCTVVQKKTVEKDQYIAVQVGFEDKKEARTTKPLQGHFKKQGVSPKQFLQEFRLDEKEDVEKGAEIKADLFKAGDRVDVIGTTKGRGFTGVMKRHNFAGYPAGHGTHECFRHGGSIGQASFPGRVFKGTKMPGRYGNDRVTIQSLEVVEVKADKNLLFVKGSVPGPNGRYVIVQKAVKYLRRKPKQAPPQQEKPSKKKAGK